MKAKKSLGQHFLTSQVIVQDIVRAAKLSINDTVLEIGPGKGMLTSALLKSAGHITAVEKDKNLFEYLQEKFNVEIKNKKLKLVHGDILTFDLSIYGLKPNTYKLVANVPYYITGEILKKFLPSKTQPHTIALLIQKEVAQRIAKEKKESILSLSVKVYGTPHYIKTVPARYFKPKPKVDSAILLIDNISKCFFQKPQIDTDKKVDQCELDEKLFFKLIKTGFAHKRKLLIKNIKSFFNNQPVEEIFDDCSIPRKARAENLSLQQWRCLCVFVRDDK